MRMLFWDKNFREELTSNLQVLKSSANSKTDLSMIRGILQTLFHRMQNVHSAVENAAVENLPVYESLKDPNLDVRHRSNEILENLKNVIKQNVR